MRNLLVASTGGHLAELHRLRPRFLGAGDDVVWVTPDSDQRRSLLGDEPVIHVRDVPPRAYRAVAANSVAAVRILRETGAQRVISTGAGIALSFLPLARASGLSCHYIESAARLDGPSVTGRILRACRGAHLYAQYEEWARPPWRYSGSVFDDITSVPAPNPVPIGRAVVTLGTLHFPFDRLLRRLREVLPPHVDVLWQVPYASSVELPGRVVRVLPHDELEAVMRDADVVICHSGIGSALAALSAGKCPVLVPREVSFGEHVDDHQRQVATLLADRGLVVTCDATTLATADLDRAAGSVTTSSGAPPPFVLEG